MLQGSLNVLNVSGNNLDSISDLQCLTELTHFSACNNLLTNMKDLNRVFPRMNKLVKLELSGNPLCQKAKYRDRVITMGTSIGKGERIFEPVNGFGISGGNNYSSSAIMCVGEGSLLSRAAVNCL